MTEAPAPRWRPDDPSVEAIAADQGTRTWPAFAGFTAKTGQVRWWPDAVDQPVVDGWPGTGMAGGGGVG